MTRNFASSLLIALLYTSASWRTAYSCHSGLARDVAQSMMEDGDVIVEGSGLTIEGSGLEALIEHADNIANAISAGDVCLLLAYKCPAGADCVEPILEADNIRSCGDHADYSLRVAAGDGPYQSIRCVSGVWYAPSGKSLDAELTKDPVLYCQRFVPEV